MHALEKEYPDARIIEGDNDAELWTPIIKNTPEVVVCGYDQGELYDALSKISDKYNFERNRRVFHPEFPDFFIRKNKKHA